jgi:hypothetical protein
VDGSEMFVALLVACWIVVGAVKFYYQPGEREAEISVVSRNLFFALEFNIEVHHVLGEGLMEWMRMLATKARVLLGDFEFRFHLTTPHA